MIVNVYEQETLVPISQYSFLCPFTLMDLFRSFFFIPFNLFITIIARPCRGFPDSLESVSFGCDQGRCANIAAACIDTAKGRRFEECNGNNYGSAVRSMEFHGNAKVRGGGMLACLAGGARWCCSGNCVEY